MQGFTNSLEHILAELSRISFLIRSCYWQAQRTQNNDNILSATQEGELDHDYKLRLGLPLWAHRTTDNYLSKTLQEMRQTIDQKIAASYSQGINLRLVEYTHLFKLTATELEIILLCLIVKLDSFHQKLCINLQGDINTKYLTVEFILNLLSTNLSEKIKLRNLFDEQAVLLKNQLVELVQKSDAYSHGLFQQEVILDDHLLAYLFGQTKLNKKLLMIADLQYPQQALKALVLPETTSTLMHSLLNTPSAFCLYLQGPLGTGKHTIAKALCTDLKRSMLSVDVQALINQEPSSWLTYFKLSLREAILNDAIICYQSFDLLFADAYKQHYKTIIKLLSTYTKTFVLTGELNWGPRTFITNQLFVKHLIPKLTTEERQQLWCHAKQQLLPVNCSIDVSEVTKRFQLSPGQIFAAVAHIKHDFSLQQLQPSLIKPLDLYQACQNQATHQLNTVAKRVKIINQRKDIILPIKTSAAIDDIINYVKNYALVYETWGFENKLSIGKGLNALFAGPPGTGKTMAAEVIAGSLNLELYKIDLSAVVSKYIGETEKNLSFIFNEAETSNAILFFDEADALFSKRSEVKNAHDRNSNMEVSYLLQRIEAYQGIVILATNFKRNIDDAFLRRLHFIVDFPFPTPVERLQIWQNIWPSKVQLANDIDLNKIATSLEMAGGNIRNIALTAAFKAAADNCQQINMPHLLQAIRLELKKVGRLVHENELNDIFLN